MAELKNIFSIKLIDGRGVALIPEIEEAIEISPALQLATLTTVLDFFIRGASEENQNELEEWLLANFQAACENRHESVEKVRVEKLKDL